MDKAQDAADAVPDRVDDLINSGKQHVRMWKKGALEALSRANGQTSILFVPGD